MGAALPALVFQRRGRLTTIAFAALARHPVSFEPTGIGESFIEIPHGAESAAGARRLKTAAKRGSRRRA